jgi:hypothetical protein
MTTTTTTQATDVTRCRQAIATINRRQNWALTVMGNGTIIATDPHGLLWRIAPWPHNLWTTGEQPFGEPGAVTVHDTPTDAYHALVTRSQHRHHQSTRAKGTQP